MFNKNAAIAILSLVSAQSFSNSTSSNTTSSASGNTTSSVVPSSNATSSVVPSSNSTTSSVVTSSNSTTSSTGSAAGSLITSSTTPTGLSSGTSTTSVAPGAATSPSALYSGYSASEILSALRLLAEALIALIEAVLSRRADSATATALYNFDEALYAAGYIFLNSDEATIVSLTPELLTLLGDITTIANDLTAAYPTYSADGTAAEYTTYISNLYGFSATLFNTVGTKLTCPEFAAFAASLDTTAFALEGAVAAYGASATVNYPSYEAFCGTLSGLTTSGSASTMTTVVTAFTTYCPYATEITTNGQVYTVLEATTLTITDCPCTLTTVSCNGCVVQNTASSWASTWASASASATTASAPVVAAASKTTTVAQANGAAMVGGKVAAVVAAAAVPFLL